jgi:hypothetical protein
MAETEYRILSADESKFVKGLQQLTLQVLAIERGAFISGSCTAGSACKIADFIDSLGLKIVSK